ncbi:hypothetical protein BGX29_009011 [Mortierella sp. GBA35]|nr:hypothetical protein BGX29_009011 [Mortierella sp. GBA35]
MQPAWIVEKSSFKRTIDLANTNVSPPCPDSMVAMLPDLFNELSYELRTVIDDTMDTWCITTDVWSSRARRPCQGLQNLALEFSSKHYPAQILLQVQTKRFSTLKSSQTPVGGCSLGRPSLE